MAIGLVLLGMLVGEHRRSGELAYWRTAVLTAPPENVVKDFWRSFFAGDNTALVAYPDAVFLIDETNDLFRFRRGASDYRGSPVDPHLARRFASNPRLVEQAGPLFYEDGYTGTGSLESVSLLTRLFTQMGLPLTVERCREVTIDDLKRHNVILMGSSFTSEAVAQLPMAGDFAFNSPAGDRELWRGRIVNRRPLPGEQAVYRTERDPATQVVKTDYALITIQPGGVPGRSVAVLAGLDTTGNEGATAFATSKAGVEELLSSLKSAGARLERGRLPFFQALLRVEVGNGQDFVGVHLVTVHLIRPGS